MVCWSENAARLPGGLFPQSFFGLTCPTPRVGQTGQVRPPELPGFALGLALQSLLLGGCFFAFQPVLTWLRRRSIVTLFECAFRP